MLSQTEAGDKIFRGAAAASRSVWTRFDDLLVGSGLTRDVKTIYISYTDDQMRVVAAVQPTSEGFEIALSIPNLIEHDALHDSIHLKWRTLPQAVAVTNTWTDWPLAHHLIEMAVRLVGTVQPRPNDAFTRRRTQRNRSSDAPEEGRRADS